MGMSRELRRIWRLTFDNLAAARLMLSGLAGPFEFKFEFELSILQPPHAHAMMTLNMLRA